MISMLYRAISPRKLHPFTILCKKSFGSLARLVNLVSFRKTWWTSIFKNVFVIRIETRLCFNNRTLGSHDPLERFCRHRSGNRSFSLPLKAYPNIFEIFGCKTLQNNDSRKDAKYAKFENIRKYLFSSRAWRLGARKFLEVVLSNISNGRTTDNGTTADSLLEETPAKERQRAKHMEHGAKGEKQRAEGGNSAGGKPANANPSA